MPQDTSLHSMCRLLNSDMLQMPHLGGSESQLDVIAVPVAGLRPKRSHAALCVSGTT